MAIYQTLIFNYDILFFKLLCIEHMENTMDTTWFMSFIVFTLAMGMRPTANNSIILSTASQGDTIETIKHILVVSLGHSFLLLLIIFGLAKLVALYAWFFLLAKYITFTNSPIKGKTQLLRYMMTVVGAILLNYILLKILVEYLYIWPTIAKIITTVIVVVYSYMLQRYFTFKTGQLKKKAL